jgi:hypothetical protein
MEQLKQWRFPAVFQPALVRAALGLALILAISDGRAAEEEDKSVRPSSASAALVLQQDGTHDMGGRMLRCQPGQSVGIWAEVRSNIILTNVNVEGCDIGVVVTGGSSSDASKKATLGVTQPSSIRVEHVFVRATTIGIFVSGNENTISNNIAGGAGYGIVVTGDDNTVTGNESNDNIADGFLITGDRNLVEGNQALRNGGVGIHVARMVPMVQNIKGPRLLPDFQHVFFRTRRVLRFIQDQALGNIIRGNTALENRLDLAEFAECASSPDDPPLENEWVNNTFDTRRPDCIE